MSADCISHIWLPFHHPNFLQVQTCSLYYILLHGSLSFKLKIFWISVQCSYNPLESNISPLLVKKQTSHNSTICPKQPQTTANVNPSFQSKQSCCYEKDLHGTSYCCLGPDSLLSPLQAALTIYWASDMTKSCKLEHSLFSLQLDLPCFQTLWTQADDDYAILCCEILSRLSIELEQRKAKLRKEPNKAGGGK